MIDPDHISVEVDRIAVPKGKWDGQDESSLVSSFHAMILVVQQPLWDAPFTLVCLSEDQAVDRFTISIDETYAPQFMGPVIEEVIKFHRGKLLAVTFTIEATTSKVSSDPAAEPVILDSKFAITIPALGNILVSEMHRDARTLEVENNGQWSVRLLEHTFLDPGGEVKAICRHLQEAIKSEREQRS